MITGNGFLLHRWGIFTHFLYGDPGELYSEKGGSDYWNRRVENFDTDRIADRLYDAGAQYYFITVMQGQKYMIAPNKTFDKICGTNPGEACANRDLIADLYDSLSRYNIDLCLYYTGDGPWLDPECGVKMGLTNPRGKVSDTFVRNWANVLAEYAEKYGNKIKAWWFDGCYDWLLEYNNEKLTCYYDAVKYGNPDVKVAFNNGVKDQCCKYYIKEDYTAGEFNDLNVIPNKAYYDGARAHILAPMGSHSWHSKGLRYSGEYLKKYVTDVNNAGGMVTLEMYIDDNGELDDEQLAAAKKCK